MHAERIREHTLRSNINKQINEEAIHDSTDIIHTYATEYMYMCIYVYTNIMPIYLYADIPLYRYTYIRIYI